MAIKEIQKNNKQKDNLLNIQTDYKIEPDKIDYHRTESTDYYVLDALFAHLVTNKDDVLVDMGAGFRVIIMTEANSSVKSKVLKLLPKLKTEETDGLCVA